MKHRTYRGAVAIVAAFVMVAAALTSYAQRGAGRGPQRPGSEAPFRSAFVPKDETEKNVLKIMNEIQANERYANVPMEDGRLLRMLTESMQAKHVVEMGTSTGYSGLWFGLALNKTGGKLTTFEIDENRANTARENFKEAGFSDIITVILGDAHEEVKKLEGPIDLLFLDADKEGYVDYLDKLLPQVRPGGLIVAHNINARMADANFIEAISNKPELETLFMQGMSLTMKKF
jgi:predicted O-methyltransferase YrrM